MMTRTLLLFVMLVMSVTCAETCPDECVCSSPGRCAAKCSRPSEDGTLSYGAHGARGVHGTHGTHGTHPARLSPSFTRIWTLIINAARTEITHLTIHDCDVRHLNVSLVGQKHLQTLDMSHNSIVEIEESFAKSLPALKSFTLHGNSITTLGNSWLRYLKELQMLDLSSNKISALLESPFESFNLVSLNLSRNKVSSLSEISLKGLESLQSLDLSSNLIGVLDNSLFHSLSSLQWLNLSGNRLEMLSEEYFIGLAHLQTLDVSANRISTIRSDSFESLSGLTELLLSDNPLGSVQKELLFLVGASRRLQTVDASSCNLSDVPATLTWSIRLLKLSNNSLTSIRRGDLDSYPLLQTLDLSDNQITDVEEDALGRLELLRSLILSGNKLRVIPNSLPSSLRILHLPNNNIEFLNVGDLQATPKLNELILRQSNIKAIQDGAFASVLELEVLDLSDNPIERLCSSVLAGPQRLRMLRLSDLRHIAGEEASELSFPITSPERLERLELSASPVLARQLMADTAALAAFRHLHHLDLKDTNLTHIRSDLFHFFPRLDVFRISTSHLECDDILWLSRWMKQRTEKDPWAFQDVRCATPIRLKAKLVVQLSDEDFDSDLVSASTRDVDPLSVSDARQPILSGKHLERKPGASGGKVATTETVLGNPFTDEDRRSGNGKLNSATQKTIYPDPLIDSSPPTASSDGGSSPDSSLSGTSLKNSRQISVTGANSTSNSAFRNNSNAINKTGKFDLNPQTHNTSGGATSAPAKSEDRQTTASVINNVITQGVNDLRAIFNEKMKTDEGASTVTPGTAHYSEQGPSSSNATETASLPRRENTPASQNKATATLRNANKKTSRNSNANITSAGDFFIANKTRGEQIFDKMMRDRLANNNSRASETNNNRVKGSENFSRVKSTSSIHQSFENRTLTSKISTSSSGPALSAGAQSSTKMTSDYHLAVSELPRASKEGYPFSHSILMPQTHESQNNTYNLLHSQKTDRNLTKFAVPIIPVPNRNSKHNKIIENDEDYLNTSAVWGTIKSMSNINLSNSTNKSELLIGIVHTKESDPVRARHHIDKSSLLFRAQTSNAFAVSDLVRRHHVDREADGASSKQMFAGSHPGMFVLLALGVGSVVGLVVGLVHCARKRRRSAVEYSRQQDIEVRSMTSLGERERW